MIGHQIFAVHACADGNHRGIVAFQHGDVVQCERVAFNRLALGFNLDDSVLLQRVSAVVKRVECTLNLAGHHVGKESQPTHVHADDGRAFRSHAAGGLQEGSVSTHRNHIVDVEIVFVEHARSLHRQMLVARDELVERTFHINLCLPLGQIRENLLYGGRFLGLELVAEKGETQFLLFLFHNPLFSVCFCKGNENQVQNKGISFNFSQKRVLSCYVCQNNSEFCPHEKARISKKMFLVGKYAENAQS